MGTARQLGLDSLDIPPAKFTAYAVIYCGVVTLFHGVLAFVFVNSLRLNLAGVGALCVGLIGVVVVGVGVDQLRSVTPSVNRHQYDTYEYIIGGFAAMATVFLLVSFLVVV